MRALTIKEAKARLNELVEAAIKGEDVVLMRGSRHVAAIIPLTEEDLYVASRVTDEQAARLWKSLASEHAAGKTLELDSMEGAVAALQNEGKAPKAKSRSARKSPAARQRAK
jgi:antitoxin (DNA-binding transcriptional repressor) of toxin-antitoxin stability system